MPVPQHSWAFCCPTPSSLKFPFLKAHIWQEWLYHKKCNADVHSLHRKSFCDTSPWSSLCPGTGHGVAKSIPAPSPSLSPPLPRYHQQHRPTKCCGSARSTSPLFPTAQAHTKGRKKKKTNHHPRGGRNASKLHTFEPSSRSSGAWGPREQQHALTLSFLL